MYRLNEWFQTSGMIAERKYFFIYGNKGYTELLSPIQLIFLLGNVPLTIYLDIVLKTWGLNFWFVEFFVREFTWILLLTFFADFNMYAFGILLVLSIVFGGFGSICRNRLYSRRKLLRKKSKERFYLQFINEYKKTLMILTITCIFAVDYSVFGRLYHKSDFFGLNLMDLGVGSFILSSGLTHNSSKGKFPIKSVFLFAAGLFRTYLMSIFTDIQNDLYSEYGLHWNFYFTLAFVFFFVYIIEKVTVRFDVVVASLLTLFHGLIWLEFFNFRTLVLNSDWRSQNFIIKNKEGIFSVTGFVAIFYWGKVCRQFFLSMTPNRHLIMIGFTISSLLTIAVSSVIFHGYRLSFLCTEVWPYVLVPSRKLVNIGYMFMIVWIHCIFFTIGQFIDFSYTVRAYKSIESRFPQFHDSTWSFAIFLFANVLCGVLQIHLPPSMFFEIYYVEIAMVALYVGVNVVGSMVIYKIYTWYTNQKVKTD